MKANGAEVIGAFLKNAGVSYIFGLMGSPMMPIMDKVHAAGDVRFIPTLHEQGAMFMAVGYARYTRKPGVCFLTTGPGATNGTTGLAEAYVESIPLVFLSMESATDRHGRPFSNSHEIDQLSVFKPITKGAWRIDRGDRIVEILERAFRTAQGGRPGPVYVGIARDIIRQDVEFELRPPESYMARSRVVPDEVSMGHATDLLAGAKNVVILAGGGVWRSDAQAELTDLAERLEAAISVAFAQQGIVPETYPLYVGRPSFAIYGSDNPAYKAVIQDADLLVILGATMSERTTSGYHKDIVPPGIDILQIDIDPAEIGKNYPVKLGLVGDIKATLRLALRDLESRGVHRKDLAASEKAQHIRQLRQEERSRYMPQATSDAVPINRLRLMKEVFDFVGPDTIISGSHGWKERVGDLNNPAFAEGGDFGTASGSGFLRSLVIKLVDPQKQVVWLAGDGSFMMVLSELGTAVAENLPIIVVVNHNAAYGNEKRSQALRYGRFIGTDLPIPDLAAVARDFGAYGERVEKPEDIRGALERAAESGKVAVVDVILDNSIYGLTPTPWERGTHALR